MIVATAFVWALAILLRYRPTGLGTGVVAMLAFLYNLGWILFSAGDGNVLLACLGIFLAATCLYAFRTWQVKYLTEIGDDW